MESVSSQSPASLTAHDESQDGIGQMVAKRKSGDGGNVKKKVRFDVPATFPLSLPLAVSPVEVIPGRGISEDPFPNTVFSFRPPEPLLSQVCGEEHHTSETAELGGGNVAQERADQPQDSNIVGSLDMGEKNEGGIFGHPAKVFGAVAMPAMSIFGQLAKPFRADATPTSHVFGQAAAKSGAVSTTTTGFASLPASLNFGGFAAATNQPATSIALFGGQPTQPMIGSGTSAPVSRCGGFGGTSTAGKYFHSITLRQTLALSGAAISCFCRPGSGENIPHCIDY